MLSRGERIIAFQSDPYFQRACSVTWIAHRAADPRVAGSNPVMPASSYRRKASGPFPEAQSHGNPRKRRVRGAFSEFPESREKQGSGLAFHGFAVQAKQFSNSASKCQLERVRAILATAHARWLFNVPADSDSCICAYPHDILLSESATKRSVGILKTHAPDPAAVILSWHHCQCTAHTLIGYTVPPLRLSAPPGSLQYPSFFQR